MEASEKTAWLSILTNLLLVGIKTAVAFISGSLAVTPDASILCLMLFLRLFAEVEEKSVAVDNYIESSITKSIIVGDRI